ncbi:cell wall elongation regulator TseB-like domain-containing protein [Streptococcus dentasini]
MKRLKIKHFWRYLFGVLGLLVLVAVGIFFFFKAALKPNQDARSQAIQTAKEYADFASVSDFNQYNGREVFYTVFGKNQDGETIMVTINKKHQGQVYVYRADQGIKAEQAQDTAKKEGARKIQKTTFGMAEGVPIWEVRADGAYYLVNFETGDLVKKEGL